VEVAVGAKVAARAVYGKVGCVEVEGAVVVEGGKANVNLGGFGDRGDDGRAFVM
jgi:hypothetical protein